MVFKFSTLINSPTGSSAPDSNRRSNAQDQLDVSGRDLSDTAHPDYDPATDPELSGFQLDN